MGDNKYDKDGVPIINEKEFSELGKEIAQGLKEAILYEKGKLDKLKGLKVTRFDQNDIDIKKIRNNLGLTQAEFATFINASKRAVQHWEQKTRKPEGPTRVLLQLLAKKPKVVWDTLYNQD